MKKNKIVVLAGTVLLTAGTILNVHDALNEFGVMEISLHPQVMAQTGSTSGYSTGVGKQARERTKCTVRKHMGTSGASSTTSSSSGNIEGSISAGNGFIGGNVSGGVTSGNQTSIGSSSNSDYIVEKEYWGTKYWCEPPVGVEPKTCYIQDPCEI